ncbi:amino acid permease [Anaerocolumna sedimenticola]|uniref:Amino acid permease n=1 Tax=Anaerocolumna sedimenticola TaxID=2696063 RepID=A0A6P1TLD6_9FIRM|nr:APC family permease [Anaerocolumna sedimenticola]QHQ60942.1 amino acid permease [Anaerocolumna sedimenticola]
MKDKKLGLGSAISVCVGLIVATSCLLSLGLGMGLAGRGFILAMFIVVILNILLAFSFSELHGMMPDVEGGLGPVPSIVSNLSAYVITNMLAGSVELAMCGIVLQETFLPQVPAVVISLLILFLLAFVNYLGVNIFARIQNLVVVLLIGSLVLLGIISAFKLGTGTVIEAASQSQPAVTGMYGIASLTALAFWLFIGIEFVIPISKDLKNPKRDVPLAMILGVLLLFVVQALMGIGMTNYVSLEDLMSSDMPHIVFAKNLLGTPGTYWMGVVTILAGVSTINTVLGSVTRILSGMAEAEMMPCFFQKKNAKGTPIAGLVMMVGVIAIVLITGFANSSGLTNILLAASCFWLASYILVNITVLVLRKRYPDAKGRNKKLTLLGIPQFICIIGDIYMIWNIAEGDARIFIYKIFFALLVVMAAFAMIWVKVIKRAKPFERVSIDKVNNVKLERESSYSESLQSI